MTKGNFCGIARSKWYLPAFSLVIGLVMLAVSWLGGHLVAWLVATARGQSGDPYGWLLAIAGLAYLLAVGWFRWRG